jgi:hypothetical protein
MRGWNYNLPYDSSRQRLLFLGGYQDFSSNFSNSLWEYNSSNQTFNLATWSGTTTQTCGSVPNPPASTGANETITIAGGRTETVSGQATGKRQHMPIRARTYYDQPQGEGSVWIRVSTPWSACRVGARYPSLSLGGGAKAYVLEDVTVAGCGAGEVALAYKKVKVRAWDPAKKEE